MFTCEVTCFVFSVSCFSGAQSQLNFNSPAEVGEAMLIDMAALGKKPESWSSGKHWKIRWREEPEGRCLTGVFVSLTGGFMVMMLFTSIFYIL